MSKTAKKKELSIRHEKFCAAVARGDALVDAYIASYPKASKWDRNAAYNKGHELAKKSDVSRRIDELKAEFREALKIDAEKKFVWTHENSVKVLAQIAVKGKSESARVSAVGKLNEMLGFNAPKKLDHSSSDGSMTPQPVIDMSKLSDSALEEIMNAKITK